MPGEPEGKYRKWHIPVPGLARRIQVSGLEPAAAWASPAGMEYYKKSTYNTGSCLCILSTGTHSSHAPPTWGSKFSDGNENYCTGTQNVFCKS